MFSFVRSCLPSFVPSCLSLTSLQYVLRSRTTEVLLGAMHAVSCCSCACCVFCSDGVIRVFTTSAERMASPAEIADYEQSVAASEIPAQIGDIKTEDLVGPSALKVPGNNIIVT